MANEEYLEMVNYLLGNDKTREIKIDVKEIERQLEKQAIGWKPVKTTFRCTMCQADNSTNDNICEYCGKVQE